MEDAASPQERPKATRAPGSLAVVVYGAALHDDPHTANAASRLRYTKISAFLLPHGLVTVRNHADGFDMDEVVRRWDVDPELLAIGPGALMHALLDTVVDAHFDTLQELDDDVEALEDGLFDGEPLSRATQETSFRLRRELVGLRRVVLPMREVVNLVARHHEETRHGGPDELDAWYTDLADHVLRVAEWTETLREMIAVVFETNLALADARLNTIMKKLTGWAAIVAVPTAITGWFGQNVPYWGFGRHFGVWLAAGTILATSGTLYLVFRRKDWL
jgi:magnesium transporter